MRSIIIHGLLVWLLLCTSAALAIAQKKQVYGFMGKKNIVSYAGIITPNFSAPNYAGNKGLTALATRHELSYQRVIGRGKMLGFSVNVFRTRAEGVGSLNTYAFRESREPISTEAFPVIGLINGQMYSLRYTYMARRLHKGAKHRPAFPIGPYLELGATYIRATFKEDSKFNTIPNTTFQSFGISIEPGVQRVISQKVLLKVGYQYVLTPPFSFLSEINVDFDKNVRYYPNTQEYEVSGNVSSSDIQSVMMIRISDQYLLGLRLSLGYIF
jgi:hypothetical protein